MAGALELASTEIRFELNQARTPVKLLTKKDLPVHALVAELMILANEYVARKIRSAYPTCGWSMLYSTLINSTPAYYVAFITFSSFTSSPIPKDVVLQHPCGVRRS